MNCRPVFDDPLCFDPHAWGNDLLREILDVSFVISIPTHGGTIWTQTESVSICVFNPHAWGNDYRLPQRFSHYLFSIPTHGGTIDAGVFVFCIFVFNPHAWGNDGKIRQISPFINRSLRFVLFTLSPPEYRVVGHVCRSHDERVVHVSPHGRVASVVLGDTLSALAALAHELVVQDGERLG